jgi:hypothetical protein
MSRALLISQIAISLVILVAAGLFVRTLSNLESIQLGFNRENVPTFKTQRHSGRTSRSRSFCFYNDLRARFASIPGVRSASLSDLPLVGLGSFTGIIVSGAKPETSLILSVGPGFFTTMQIPLLLGREIQQRDMTRSHLVAVVGRRAH